MSPIKITLICAAGTILEWYDFSIFTSMFSIVSALFFPNYSSSASFMAVLLVFFIGFIVRPIGAILSGYLGDLFGRKISILFSLILMTISTFSIGLLPTYDSIGNLAPILLILLRILQGLSSSGEHAGAITYLSEVLVKRKTFFLSLIFCAVMLGNLLGSGMSTVISILISREDIINFWWRVPFLLSMLLGIVGYIFRVKIQETPAFTSLKFNNEISPNPILDTLKYEYLNVFLVGGIFSLNMVVFYAIFIYLPAQFLQENILNSGTILIINSISLLFMCIVIPVVGYISEKNGGVFFIKLSMIGLILFTYPLMSAIKSGNYTLILISQCSFAFCNALLLAPAPNLFTKVFQCKNRYSGVSISLNFSAAIFGGLSPIIMATFKKNINFQSLYIVSVAVIALTCCSLIEKRTHKVHYLQENFI